METNTQSTKVWVLLTSEAYGYDLETKAMVYSSMEEAQKALDDFAHKRYDSLTSMEWIINSKTDNGRADGSYTKGWCSYKGGHYFQFHSIAEILERDVL